jgi:hypothetical protein
MNGANGNKVFFENDGLDEMVLNEKGNLLVNDLINGTSHNYFSPFKSPLQHFAMDTYPFVKWGRNGDNYEEYEDRVNAYFLDLLDSIDYVKNFWGARVKDIDTYMNNKDAERFFMLVLNDRRLEKYNFSSRDSWFSNKKEYEIFKETLRTVFMEKFEDLDILSLSSLSPFSCFLYSLSFYYSPLGGEYGSNFVATGGGTLALASFLSCFLF